MQINIYILTDYYNNVRRSSTLQLQKKCNIFVYFYIQCIDTRRSKMDMDKMIMRRAARATAFV